MMKQALSPLSIQDRPAHAMHVCRFSLLPSHAPNSTHRHLGHGMHLQRCRQSSRLRAQQKTAEPQSLRAPGSESNFDDLPKNRDEIDVTTIVSDKQMQEHIELAKADFPLVFKDILDLDHFEQNMYFSDPISRFTFFRGYQFNVTFLRIFLAPIFEVHEIRQAGPHELLLKWSWTMNFWWLRYTPFKSFWDPRLAFTGITILGFDSETGKWNKHVDGWDCLEDQEFFSLEGAAFVLRQMGQVSKPPNRPTPEFAIMKKYKDWEIRRYKPYVAAQVASTPEAVAEALLREYLAGANEGRRNFELTTPLLHSSDGAVSCMVPGVQEAEQVPRPSNPAVSIQRQPERWVAAGLFGGHPSPAEIQRQQAFVRARARQEGSRPEADGSWVFARYNDPRWPLGPFRRNEVLVPIDPDSFDLWRGVDFDFVKRVVERPV